MPWQITLQPADIAQRQFDPKATLAFLVAARPACLWLDRVPHVAPVRRECDRAHSLVAAWQGSLRAEYVPANLDVSLSVDEPWPSLQCMSARGEATPP
jgi:hypothetical protein